MSLQQLGGSLGMPWKMLAYSMLQGCFWCRYKIKNFFSLTITAYHKSVINSIYYFLQKSGVAMASIVAVIPTSLYIQPKVQNIHLRVFTSLSTATASCIHAGPLCFSTSPTSHWSKSGLVLGQRRGEQWIHHLGVHQELDHLWWQRQRHWGTVIPLLTVNKKNL